MAEVFVGRVRESTATTTPQRRGGHTRAGAIGTLLVPGLTGRVAHELTAELSARTLTGVSLVGNHELVHQSFVVFAAEHGVRGSGFARFLTEFIDYIQFH